MWSQTHLGRWWPKKEAESKETDRWRWSGGQAMLVIDETTGES